MPPDHECEMKSRIEALENDNKRHSDTHKDFYARFDRINEHMIRTDERYTKIREDSAEIKENLKQNTAAIQALNEKPAKRWEGIVDKAVWAVCAAVIAFVLAKIGIV